MNGKSFGAQFKDLCAHIKFDFPRLPENLSPKERREILVKRKKQLSEEILKFPKNSNERKFLGVTISELNEEISKIRKKFKGTKDLSNYFIDVARESLSRPTFETIMKEAIRRAGLIPLDDLDDEFKIKPDKQLVFK